MKIVVSEITIVNENILKELNLVKSKFKNLSERHLHLQTCSMRNNLIFEGILETQEENTEKVPKESLKSEMDKTEKPQFKRVHRMGKMCRTSSITHREICSIQRKRKKVRKAAPSTFAEKPLGINEEFPKEINHRRTLLNHNYKQAKQL